ncbi:MAG: 2-amino-4-hydroxy-6-hydroxymethyldihydropteridine diphosphokinase [Dehalococcoidia bacterium]|nr:2-amino-4-hydroxy-6-hydroxymethyldihydropteridine diphosphokinase [Dehalococcoidia bacterium]
MPTRRVSLALGSNLGDRREHLRVAVEELRAGGAADGVAIDAVSALYETPPWGVADQPAFLNIAASGMSDLDARALLALAKRIEAAHGRDFGAARWSARPLDIDIALIEDETVAEPDLVVPHALLAERAFVLVPLAEVAGEALHPGLARSIAVLRDARPQAERDAVRRVAERGWERAVDWL